jgi:hypothetical protein
VRATNKGFAVYHRFLRLSSEELTLQAPASDSFKNNKLTIVIR